jgi:hypothetical protein
MKVEHAQLLMQAAEEEHIDAVAHDDYSGRGMYGKTTAAVVVPDVPCLMAMVGRAVLAAQRDNGDPDDFIEATRSFRTDSLGMDMIVY